MRYRQASTKQLVAYALPLTAISILAGRAILDSGKVDATAETVLRYQQAYFDNIASLQFTARTTLRLSSAVQRQHGIEASTVETEMRFVSSGTSFRSDVRHTDFAMGEAASTTRAYNGELYQTVRWSEKPVLHVTREHTWHAATYGGMHPLLTAFSFAFVGGEQGPLSQLSSNELWSDLSRAVLNTEEASMLGHEGIRLEFGKRTGKRFAVFFAEGLDYLPIYWRALYPEGGSSECSVVGVESCDTAQGRILIPSRLEFADRLADGTVAQDGDIEIDPQSLTVNFTIPPSVAHTYSDEDAGVQMKPQKPAISQR